MDMDRTSWEQEQSPIDVTRVAATDRALVFATACAASQTDCMIPPSKLLDS